MMSGTAAVSGGVSGIVKWWLVLGICWIVPAARLPSVLSKIDKLLFLERQSVQHEASKFSEHQRSLLVMVGEELQRIEATMGVGSPLQRRLADLQQEQRECVASLTGGTMVVADRQFSHLLRELTGLHSVESGELQILREQLQVAHAELRALAGGAEQEEVHRVCEAVERLQSEWAQRLLSPAAGELKRAAGSLLVRSMALRQRLSSQEVPIEDLLARAGGLVVAEQVIVQLSEVERQRREELRELREEQLRSAEQLQCVQLEIRQEQERMQRLRGELTEVQRLWESADRQWQQREQMERTTAEARGEVERESELLRLASEVLRQEILAEGADESPRGGS